jgi:hypothetical protein
MKRLGTGQLLNLEKNLMGYKKYFDEKWESGKGQNDRLSIFRDAFISSYRAYRNKEFDVSEYTPIYEKCKSVRFPLI